MHTGIIEMYFILPATNCWDTDLEYFDYTPSEEEE